MKLTEIKGDLFTCDDNDALVHCVSKDFHMGKGIATEFKTRYGNVQNLLNQNCNIGDVATLQHDGRYIFYMVTKLKYWHQPTFDDFSKTLHALKDKCVEHNVKSLSMPRIGCGLDRLQWETVRKLICTVFSDVPININVYVL